MNSPEIPGDLEAEQRQQAAAELQAQQRLQEAQQQRIAQAKRLNNSLKALAGNADFEHWMTHYLAADVALKLEDLEKAHNDDLPLARQRWKDAKNMLHDLTEALREARETPETKS